MVARVIALVEHPAETAASEARRGPTAPKDQQSFL
jgi:hypothetical protein